MRKNKKTNNFFVNMNWAFPIIVFFISPTMGIILAALKIISTKAVENEERERRERAEALRRKYGSMEANLYSSNQSETVWTSSFDEAGSNTQNATAEYTASRSSYAKRLASEEQKRELKRRKIGMIILFTIGGIAAIYGFGNFFEGLESLSYGWFDRYTFFEELIPGLAGLATSFGLFKWGVGLKKDLKDEETLRAIVGNKDYDTITHLRHVTGFSRKKTVHLVKDAIAHGYFGPDAYFDVSKDSIVVRGVAPDNPDSLFGEEKATPVVNQSDDSKKADNTKFGEDKYSKILRELHEINEAIPGEEMTAKISELENLSARIFEIAKSDPNKEKMLGRFMDYYLPTSKKLLTTYATLDKQGYEGANIKETKASIEENMDALIQAFKLQLDKLFEADALDISTDIATLNKMFDMDGIAESDFLTLNK